MISKEKENSRLKLLTIAEGDTACRFVLRIAPSSLFSDRRIKMKKSINKNAMCITPVTACRKKERKVVYPSSGGIGTFVPFAILKCNNFFVISRRYLRFSDFSTFSHWFIQEKFQLNMLTRCWHIGFCFFLHS